MFGSLTCKGGQLRLNLLHFGEWLEKEGSHYVHLGPPKEPQLLLKLGFFLRPVLSM